MLYGAPSPVDESHALHIFSPKIIARTPIGHARIIVKDSKFKSVSEQHKGVTIGAPQRYFYNWRHIDILDLGGGEGKIGKKFTTTLFRIGPSDLSYSDLLRFLSYAG